MKLLHLKIIITFFVLMLFKITEAQNNDTITTQLQEDTLTKFKTEINVEITLNDGNILRGAIIKQSEDTIRFYSKLTGAITILKSNILTIKYFNEANKGSQQVYINLSSRYFFSPSAINMKKGDGYYQNTWFSFHTFNYAITDYFTLGGGFELFSLLVGHPIFMITPKVGIPISDKLHVGAGLLYIDVLSTNSKAASIAFGNITYGDDNANISVNIGTSIDNPGKPVLTINGFKRISPKFGVMTENWIIPSNNGNNYNIYSFGGRVIGRKNFFDFGLITNEDIAQFIIGIPFLSYTLRF